MDLLFELCTFHSLAKLRCHTEWTLDDLDHSVERLGKALRTFESDVCADFATKDLPSEARARGRRAGAQAAKAANTHQTERAPVDTSEEPKGRAINLNSYKVHALGDYPRYIRLFGTSDNYTSALSERVHPQSKRYYQRCRKGVKYHVKGIARHMRRERIMYNLKFGQPRGSAKRRKIRDASESDANPALPFAAKDPIPRSGGPSRPKYEMSHEAAHPLHLPTWLRENASDPALSRFLDHLKDHLLSRALGHEYNGDDSQFTDDERHELVILDRKIYRHKIVRINYTTYDLEAKTDSLNARTHANVMLRAYDSVVDHPYWYARILGAFHCKVYHPALQKSTTMDFLWVRWYGLDTSPGEKFGWKERRLPQIGFLPDSKDQPAFGFIDPNHIIRAADIRPVFAYGSTDELLGASPSARQPKENDLDYCYFFVNVFVDRDMMMRYRGGGIGHTETRELTNRMLKDRHKTDTIFDPHDISDLSSSKGSNSSQSEHSYDTSDEEHTHSARSSVEDDNNDDSHHSDDVDLEEEEDYGYGSPEDSGSEAGDDEEIDGSVIAQGEDDDDVLGAEDGDGSSDSDELPEYISL